MAPVDAGRPDEADVTFDIYPYPAGSSIPVSFLPSDAQEGGPAAILRRLARRRGAPRIAALARRAQERSRWRT